MKKAERVPATLPGKVLQEARETCELPKEAGPLLRHLLPPGIEPEIHRSLAWAKVMGIPSLLPDCDLKPPFIEGRELSKKPIGFGSTHPVFYGTWKFYMRFPSDKNASIFCALFLTECRRALEYDEQEVSADAYYRNVLAIRDTLIELLPDAERIEFSELGKCRNWVISQLEQMFELTDKQQTCLDITSGARKLGIPSFHRSTEIQVNQHSSPIPDSSLDSSDGAALEIIEEDAVDDAQNAVVERKSITREQPAKGSRLSAKDDRHQLQHRMHAVAARNVPAVTDLHRLNLPVVGSYLAHLAESNDIWFCFAWLLETTGIDPDRLELLETSSTLPKSEDDEKVYFHPKSGCLVYAIINGATLFDTTNRKRLLKLLMPDWVRRILSAHKNPFTGILAALDKDVRNYKLHHAGVTPVANRLAASFYTLFAEQHFTSLEAGIITGNIPGRLKAQARYYALDITTLNQKFQQAHEQFVHRLQKLSTCRSKKMQQRLDSIQKFSRGLPNGLVGSQLADKPESLQPLVASIQQLFGEACRRVRTSIFSQRLAALEDALSLQQANLYLLLQIYTAVRPIGDKTSISFSQTQGMAVVADKDSTRYTERRMTPFHDLVIGQIEACQDDLRSIEQWLNSYEMLDQDLSHFVKAIPKVMAHKAGITVSIRRMSGSEFRKTLKRFGLESLFPQRNNAWRHIAASTLNGKVPEIVLDELMGHDREGLDFTGHWSTASLPSFNALDELLREQAISLGFDVLRIGEFK